MELKQFVVQHTMLPLRRAVVQDSSGDLLGGAKQGTTLWALAMRPTRSHLYLCQHCVAEDIDFHGVAYWRREHQIPGQFFCGKHGEALQCANDADATKSFPSDFIGEADGLLRPWLDQVRNNALVGRYLDLCTHMLQRGDPPRELYVCKVLIRRATLLGLHTGKGAVRKALLSDLIREQVGQQWLEALVPAVEDFRAGQLCPPIDGPLSGKASGFSVSGYLLAFAALYEETDEALNAFAAVHSQEPVPPKTVSTRPRVASDQLLASYVRNQGNHVGVACEIGLDPSDATGQLSALGLPRLGKLGAEKLKSVLDSILSEGETFAEACRMAGVDPDAVRRSLAVALAPLRSALKQMSTTDTPEAKREHRTEERVVGQKRRFKLLAH